MKDMNVLVAENEKLGEGIYKMKLKADKLPKIKAGQFVQVKLPDESFILRRPFCVYDYDEKGGTFEIAYMIKGEGTKRLAEVKAGESLKCLLPLGNGFTLPDSVKKIMLIGGGMGGAVLPAIFTEFPDKEVSLFLGFATKDNIIISDMMDKSVFSMICTDDGSCGRKGFVTTAAREHVDKVKPDVILACGPEAMYKAMQKEFADVKIPILVSLEGRMGCGFGACLVCACKIKKKGKEEETLRVCKDGPVFDLWEVVL